MNWQRASKYHMVSDIGYKIAKFKVGDDWKYRAFTPKDDFDYQPIELFDDPELAKKACEEHFNEKN
ncbi:hypothetical protein [Entomomonas asaccharolytica]|uniref:Uncharacterized protein n=1 Tax=Entomomonas asaccharolytica TaxID=2785331 RepID=A0A974NHW2_9GAMM|nr:hypothetical protein [Entomomonas asaccharolytica]QQP86924.1 hypothetical protein JHT90_06680 [Entomomonas asaccharolytica]